MLSKFPKYSFFLISSGTCLIGLKLPLNFNVELYEEKIISWYPKGSVKIFNTDRFKGQFFFVIVRLQNNNFDDDDEGNNNLNENNNSYYKKDNNLNSDQKFQNSRNDNSFVYEEF